jgi:PPE-repeat protein
VVPPTLVSANRTRLVQLLSTNRFGTNTAAIAETENEYQTMWANNSSAMTRYQATTNQATTSLAQFSSPLPNTDPAGTANQANVLTANAANAPAAAGSSLGSTLSSLNTAGGFDPLDGWFGLANQWGNQFISSGFPINLLSYAAQNTSATALQSVGGDIGSGLSEGLGAATASLSNAIKGIGAAPAPSALVGVGVSMGKLTAPPAVVGLLPGAAPGVQLASAVSPLPAGESGLPMMPMMVPPPQGAAGTGWRKRKQQKYEDVAVGQEVKGKVMPRNPSAG